MHNAPRLSPYVRENLLKFKPEYLLPTERRENEIEIECISQDLASLLSYKHYTPVIQEEDIQINNTKCALCQSKPQQFGKCSECKKYVCAQCMRQCGNCGLYYCKVELRYDYSVEKQICLNCQNVSK